MFAEQPVAIIDIGSNSVRLVVYSGATRIPSVIFNEKVLAGLGKAVGETGAIDPEAEARALAALERFTLLVKQM
jgi:exopolyphosphatase/guanosine-5'-triphosphate,3'-diphosphate pyrophosphatase